MKTLRPKTLFDRVCIVAFAAMLWLAACSRVDDLPEIPPIDTDPLEPQVRSDIDNALARLQRRPGNATSNGRLGMILHTYQIYPAAEIAYRRARQLHARSPRWAYYHADVLLALGWQDKAISALRDAIDLDPDYAPAYGRLAGLLIRLLNLEESAALLDRVLTRDPDNAGSLRELGRLLNLQDKPRQAIDAFEHALAISGPDARTYFSLAAAYERLGERDQLNRYRALHQKYLRQPRQEWDPLMAAITAMNRSSSALLARAKSHYVAGDIDAAIDLIVEVLKRQPDNLPAHVALVGIYARTGQFDLAEKHYEFASALDPIPSLLYLNLAVARIAEQRWIEAAALMEQGLAIDPNNAAVQTQLGQILTARGQIDDAITHYRKALENDPDLIAAREALGRLLVQTGRHEEAIATLDDIHPTDDEISIQLLLTLATAHERLGDIDAAINALQLALTSVAWIESKSLEARIRSRLKSLNIETATQ